MKNSPLNVIPKSISMLITNRCSFPEDRVNKAILREDGQAFRIFREMQVKPIADQPETPGGIFQVWFSTKAAPEQTKKLSNLTILGFTGMPGFRSKIWLLNPETNEFGGIYEFDTEEQALAYQASFAMKFSEWRSMPGHFRTVVFPSSDTRATIRYSSDR